MGIENIYQTRTMMKAVILMKPVHTFLRDTFFSNKDTQLTETVDVDIKKGKRPMAPFVAPRIGGVVVDRDGFETKTLKTPKIAPERVLNLDDINKRGMGEAVYSTRTPEERARELLATDLIDLDELITRREEWMCREVLFNGKVLITGEGFEQEVNYNFTNKETLIGAALWTATTSDPFADLKKWRLEVIQNTGKSPNIAIFASDVVDTFLGNEKVKTRLYNLRMNLGIIEPSIKDDAVTFIGKIAELGLEIYAYDEWYLDDDGTEKPFIPEGNILIGSKGMNQIVYGAVTQMENGNFITYEGERVPKQWADDKNEVRMLRMTSRPLPAPRDVDSWYVAVVK